jgi:hypothetical protein
MDQLPLYIPVVFGLTTFLTVFIFSKAVKSPGTVLVILIAWLLLQAIVALTGFYTVTNTLPPRFALLVLPPFLTILGLFVTKNGRKFIDGIDIKFLTLLHTVRIPVEIVLLWLFFHKAVPQMMTFEGRNYDIFSGLTAPIIYYFGFIRKSISAKIMVIWNLFCLTLLINIVFKAVFSAPFPFQLFGFEQPDIAVFYFPFIWLPCCVVPIVLLSHLATLRQLFVGQKKI